MADVELLPCAECGMPCRAGEYHPFAACLMFKACHNSETVRANLAPLQAENERLAEALRKTRARTADLSAWLKSGNFVPADLPFVFRERWQKIAADIRALEAAQEDHNG